MGVCRRNVPHRRVCAAPVDLSLCRVFCRRPTWFASRHRNHRAHLHPHFPKRRDDYFDVANYRRAVAADQLQRFLRPHDHVRAWCGEQRLDSSARSRVTVDSRIDLPKDGFAVANIYRSRAIYFARAPFTIHCSMETDYKVKLEVFEGPLDLLLFLIKRDEIDIYDISIERITRQYLEYLQAFKELKIDVAGEFVVMAANLIYLKSRSLLPLDQQPPEEDAEEDDPRW